ncbi:hypothetical protein SEA_COMRADE_240 [Streptomyces phage Comrade]|uniref:Uncharacterized protein n=2 Tax=Gilsonvirus comrade TaxID=2846395 RepID=A0A345MEE3_9CAUD|nr:hypothetical protein HWB84_gp038 [Streptomyces phage Comrade]AXH68924.1 hypothetical protein SEA_SPARKLEGODDESS_245 [Streptomyces phage SparkleGoddess]AXQ63472.1 hypothetical protein SEA_COMRADE_240 [Streptomyces phage Comrade]QZE11809.1 hypothetical protein SEA_KARP_243 [Streptomyces phage Karp]UTN92466.1 hypothetical protein SEA_STIGMA_242 [Streptomyces phage Stigma]
MLDKMILKNYPGIQVGGAFEWIYKYVPIGVLNELIRDINKVLTPDEVASIIFIRAGGTSQYGNTTWSFRVEYNGFASYFDYDRKED